MDKNALAQVRENAALEENDMHLLPTEKIEELVAANNVEAIFIYGTRIRLGMGAFKNEERGWQYTYEAARCGHAVALGLCFDLGKYVKQDEKKAATLYEASARRNHPAGLNNLGTCYQHGTGVIRDEAQAVQYYQLSAQQKFATACYNLAW